MGEANAAPDEKEGQAGESEKPVENLASLRGLADVGQETEGKLDQDTPERATLGVNVHEELGGMATLSHSLHGSGRSECARVGDGKNGNGNDGVEDRRQNLDAGILDSQDERRGLGVGATGVEETRVIAANDNSDDEQVDNVEESDTPEDLLASSRDGASGVGGLGSGKANHLSTTEGESGDDKDGAEALEAGESAGVVPVLDSEISLVTDTTAVDDDTEDDEADTGNDLDDGKNELDCKTAG